MDEHTCVTADGVRIVLGLRVKDYDCEIGTVVDGPTKWDGPCDGRGWSMGPEAHGCWWYVKRDKDGAVRSFDGSRMTTRGVT
jgi:hypothetical protein